MDTYILMSTIVSSGMYIRPDTRIYGSMRMDMSEIEVGKKISFVAKYGPMGDKVILIVPKEYHGQIQKMKNPLKITAEEILE